MMTPTPRRAARVTLCLAAVVTALVMAVPAVSAQSDSYQRDTLPPATSTTRPGDVSPSTSAGGPTTTQAGATVTTTVSPDTTATTITGRPGGGETTLPVSPTSTPGEETRREPGTLEPVEPSGALPVTGGDVLGLVLIGGGAIAAGMGVRRIGRRRG